MKYDRCFFSPITLFKCTGSLLVVEKNGQYTPCGSFVRVSVALLLLLCDFQYLLRLKSDYGNLFTSADGFAAKQLVSFITNLLYQFMFLQFLFFILLKSGKVASLLNQFCETYQILTSNRVWNNYVFSLYSSAYILIMSIMLYRSNRRTQTFLPIMCYVTIDAFVKSCSFQIIYFIKLLQQLSFEMNKQIKAISKKSDVADLIFLQNAHIKLFKLQEELQSLFGFPALVAIFDQGLYFVNDCSDMVAFFVRFYYSESDMYDAMIKNIWVYLIWASLDLCFVLWLIFTCAKTENQVCIKYNKNNLTNILFFKGSFDGANIVGGHQLPASGITSAKTG